MIHERDLAVYLDETMRQRYRRALAPAFQGIVTSFVQQTGFDGATTQYLCFVRRTGEGAADGNLYPVLGEYVPVVGDLVECWWRDDATAYVLGSLVPQRSRFGAHVTWPAGSQADASGAWTKIPYSTVVHDPAKMFRPATSDFLVPFRARWRATGYGVDNGTAGGIVVALFRNGGPPEYKRFVDLQRNNSGNSGGGGSIDANFEAGDVLDVRIFNRDASGHNIVPSEWLCYAALQLVGGA